MGTKAEIVTVACASCGKTGDVLVVAGVRTWTSHPRGWFVRTIPNAPEEFVCSRPCLMRKEERYAAHDSEITTCSECGNPKPAADTRPCPNPGVY